MFAPGLAVASDFASAPSAIVPYDGADGVSSGGGPLGGGSLRGGGVPSGATVPKGGSSGLPGIFSEVSVWDDVDFEAFGNDPVTSVVYFRPRRDPHNNLYYNII